MVSLLRLCVIPFVIVFLLITLTLPNWLEELMNKLAELIEKLVNFIKTVGELLLKLVKLTSILEEEKGGSGNYSRET